MLRLIAFFRVLPISVLASIIVTTSPAAAEMRDVAIQQEIPRINRISNSSFESSFEDGVAKDWQTFKVSGSAIFKENAKLGPIGGGIYGARERHEPSGQWNADYQTIRLAGKVNLVDIARADVVKTLQDELGPDVITVAKFNCEAWFSQRGEEVLKSRDPVAQGRDFADYCYQQSKEAGYFAHCYYGLNEPHVNSAEDMVKICAFEKSFTQRLHQHGLRSIVLNNSTGTPGIRRNMLMPEVRSLLEVADYVGYHCYGGPEDELMCAPSSTPNSMRWRTFARWYEERGWRFPPVIYTESTTWGGWHDQFAPELIRDDIFCMAYRMKDEPWSIGMCLFCTGCWKGQIWCKWDMSAFPEIIEQLRQYNLQNPVDAHSGRCAQQICSKSDTLMAGITQAFQSRPKSNMGVTAWMKYEFANGWPCRLRLQVGIDKTGQTRNPRAGTIEWSDELISQNGWDSDIWYQHSMDFSPTEEKSSIWIKATQGNGPDVRVSIDDVIAYETP